MLHFPAITQGEEQGDDMVVCQQQNDCGVHCQNDCKVDSSWRVDYESYACAIKTTDPGYAVLQRKEGDGRCSREFEGRDFHTKCDVDANCTGVRDGHETCLTQLRNAQCSGGEKNEKDCSSDHSFARASE